MRHASRLAALARAVAARRLPQAESHRVVVYKAEDGPPEVDFGEGVRVVLFLPDNGRDPLPPSPGKAARP